MNELRSRWNRDCEMVYVGTVTDLMSHDTSSESQTAFLVAGIVLLGLPFILMIGMAALAMAAGAGYIPGAASGLPSQTTSVLLLFFLIWSGVSVVAVLMFVARVLRRSSRHGSDA
jgi:membrane protein implicated in regulation of membrane protease activity